MKLSINDIPKFVINLKRRPDRLEEVTKEFKYMGWEFERFDAIDTNSYVGCAYSHKEIAKIILERGYDYAMVFEDDIFFMPYTKESLPIIENELNNIKWSFFHFAPSIHRPLTKFNENLVDLTNLPPKDEVKHRGIYGTSGFILTKEACELIVKWDTNEIIENISIQKPIDEYLDLGVYPTIKSFCYKLPLITQKSGFSDINGTVDSTHYLMTYNWNVYVPDKLPGKYFEYQTCLLDREKEKTKVKIITSIYSDLFGTELGGRPSRRDHYRFSLLSLLKMSDADFVCYTSDREYDDLIEFFHIKHNISKEKLIFKIFDLTSFKYTSLINQFKDVEKTKLSDRCVEIQYAKFHWFNFEDKSYDYYYWFDAGLSHCGLLPIKYLPLKTHQGYYETPLFNNTFLRNLISFSDDKFVLVGKENSRNFWEGTVSSTHYTKYDNSVHIIGGFFGGKKELWDNIVNLFEEYLNTVTLSDNRLYYEEQIMSLLYQNHKELFKTLNFDIWWPELSNSPSGVTEETFKNNKSFYKILEELN